MSPEQIQALLQVAAAYTGAVVLLVSVIAALTSIITEVTKEWGFLAKIPTNAQVSVLAIVLTVVAYFILNALNVVPFTWYMIVAAIFLGFITALVAMVGWSKVIDIFKSKKYPEENK